MKKWIKMGGFILAGVLINLAGMWLSRVRDLPYFLNTIGTILVTYVYGLVPGILTVVLSNCLDIFDTGRQLFFALGGVIEAVVVAGCKKKSKFFDSFLTTSGVMAVVSAVKSLATLIVLYIFFGGKTVIPLTDAIIDYLGQREFPLSFMYLIAAVWVCSRDAFTSYIFLFFVIKIHKALKKKNDMRRYLRRNTVKTAKTVAIVGLLCLALGNSAEADESTNFISRYYSSSDGLMGGTANDIAQSKDGTLWIGSYGGLYVYNGSRFNSVNTELGIRSVDSVFVDSQDRVWIGTNGAGVVVVDKNIAKITIDTEKGLPSDTIKDIIEDENGGFYVGSTSNLAYLKNKGNEIEIVKIFDEIGYVTQLKRNNRGDIVALTYKGDIYLLDEGEILDSLSPESPCTAVGFDRKDDLFYACEDSKVYSARIRKGTIAEQEGARDSEISDINDIYFDSLNNAYVASDSGLGFISRTNQFRRINTGDLTSSIEHIFCDYQGNLWLTSSRKGLLCLSKSAFTDAFTITNLEEAVTNSITKWNGNFYVGTDNGLYIMDGDLRESYNDELTELLNGVRVRETFVSSDNSLWICTYSQGAMAVTENGTFTYNTKNGGVSDRARNVTELKDGTIVVSGNGGLDFIKDYKLEKSLELEKELTSAVILSVLELNDGTILCGTDGDGVLFVKDDKIVKAVSREDGLDSGVVLRLVPDRLSDGIFAVTGSGIDYFDSDYNVHATAELPYYNNFDLYINNNRKVFVLGGAGIFVVNYDDFVSGEDTRVTVLDGKLGLPDAITSNAWNYMDPLDNLYICGRSGIYKLDTRNYAMRVSEYRAGLSQVAFDKEEQYLFGASNMTIPAGVTSLELTVGINNFTTTDPVVRYYLTPFDEEKRVSRYSELQKITYKNLPKGNYEFHIEVLDDDDKSVVSSKIYNILKEPELYETPLFLFYFYSGLAIVIFMIITTIVGMSINISAKANREELLRVVSNLEREKTEALEKALSHEESLNQAKSAFLASMSHEIRTPINAILGFDTMILRESDQPEIKKYAENVQNAGGTLLFLINQILDFSKLESGKMDLVIQEYNTKALIDDLVNMIKPKAQGKGLELETIINPDTPKSLCGDEMRIKQVVLNLLNNAVKYTDKGKITFRVDFEEAEGDNIALTMSVADTGIGIKKEDINKIFSPYSRFDTVRNKGIEGTGLGLNITKSLLELMDSTLMVRSEYGEGSEFSFTIIQPRLSDSTIGSLEEEKKKEKTESHELFHAPSANVLLVDDIEINLWVVENLLKRTRVNVDMCQSGAEAVELAKKKEFDVIFLDSMMPGMSGEETMNAIKAECPLNANKPIIVLTAHAIKGAREEFLDAGFTDYISKPVDGEKLEEVLMQYLPNEKLEDRDNFC